MELLIEWEDGEAPPPAPPPGLIGDDEEEEEEEDEVEDGTVASWGRVEREPVAAAAAGLLAEGPLARREEVDFRVEQRGGGGGGASKKQKKSITQWIEKAALEELVTHEALQEALLGYHRRVSHISRLVASG